ncbi:MULTISPECIES: AAA family ATPase [unclassified Bradyrhizobium]|uniref:AAA family ATPase n=1 Tax=unclassified Bradyrhizobium TaxID=2631580 RepID=UPI0028F07C9D|nr:MULTISPECIES: AAA family ATPase [unclassified Bradyrhizobium]
MRIKALRLAWFRGAADPVEFGADGKSWGIYGCNGAGKSSFVDSIEYSIKGGKIGHLVSEYSGRNQEKAIPNTHTPANGNTEFTIKFQDGSELNVKIARNGTHTRTGTETVRIEHWDYRRTVLRQDEVAEFISSRKGEKYSALLPLFGLHELEVAAENLRKLGRSVEIEARLPQKQGALGQIRIKRRQVFGTDDDASIEGRIAVLYAAYCPSGRATAVLDLCTELEVALIQRIGALSTEHQQHFLLRTLAELDFPAAVNAVRNSNAQLAGSIEPLITEKLAVLQSADAFAEKLEGDSAVDCPACGQEIAADAFKAHVEAEQQRLGNIIAVFDQRRAAVSTLIDNLKTLKTALGKAELATWRAAANDGELKQHLEWIEASDPESYRRFLREDDLGTIETYGRAIASAAAIASRDAPPDIAELSRDKMTVEAARAVAEAQALAEEIARIEGLAAFISALEAGIRSEIRQRSEEVISEISDDIADMWKALHPGEPIDNVRLFLPDEDKAIDVALRFHGKDLDSPRLTLSEGYRNSLGLCIFLALAKREAGNDRPLILDDVVVSLDRNHRGMIVDLLKEQFADRQVIIFTHDRDWYAELRHQLDGRSWGFKALLPYETPELGIRFSQRTSSFADARANLKDRPDSAGNDARKIMDVELALIAERLEVRLPYLRGERNDHRMWSEFLDRLVADGKKCLQKKSGADYPCYNAGLDDIDAARRLLVSWGNRSSHSSDVVRSEATKLIEACEKALNVFQCSACRQPLWMADAANKEWVQCQCGELRWRYGKS